MEKPILPDFLQGADKAGIIRTRHPTTEAAYRKRYAGMERTLARKLQEPHVEVYQVIDNLRDRAKKLASRSYYLYRAAVFQILRDQFLSECISIESAKNLAERLREPIDRTSSASETRKGRRPVRRRSISTGTRAVLATILRARPSATAQNLSEMLQYGPELGLRPCEFFGAQLVGRTLFIKAAKVSPQNGRGIAAERPLELLEEEFSETDLDAIGSLVESLNAELDAVGGDRTKLVRRYGDMMRRVRGQVASARRVTIKTMRHQAKANLSRAGYSREEISAILGHRVTDTADKHYGLANRGWSSRPGYRPIAVPDELVSRVRHGARSKARRTNESTWTGTPKRAPS
jgi:hypothetical protein